MAEALGLHWGWGCVDERSARMSLSSLSYRGLVEAVVMVAGAGRKGRPHSTLPARLTAVPWHRVLPFCPLTEEEIEAKSS